MVVTLLTLLLLTVQTPSGSVEPLALVTFRPTVVQTPSMWAARLSPRDWWSGTDLITVAGSVSNSIVSGNLGNDTMVLGSTQERHCVRRWWFPV